MLKYLTQSELQDSLSPSTIIWWFKPLFTTWTFVHSKRLEIKDSKLYYADREIKVPAPPVAIYHDEDYGDFGYAEPHHDIRILCANGLAYEFEHYGGVLRAGGREPYYIALYFN